MRYLRIAAAAAILVLGVAASARADRLRFCFEEWTPFSAIADGEAVGIAVAVMDRLLSAIGHTATYAEVPYLRCANGTRNGIYDAMLMSSDEAGLIPMRVSAAFWEVGIVARPDWPADGYASLRDFDGASVGLVNAYGYHPAVEHALADWRVHFTSEAMFNLRKVASGRIDFTIVDIPWARIQARREGLTVKILTPTLFATPQYAYFNPAKARIIPELDAALLRLIEDGTVDRLYEQAIGTSYEAAGIRAANALIRD